LLNRARVDSRRGYGSRRFRCRLWWLTLLGILALGAAAPFRAVVGVSVPLSLSLLSVSLRLIFLMPRLLLVAASLLLATTPAAAALLLARGIIAATFAAAALMTLLCFFAFI
jgi:hypothetical protein